MNSIFNRVIRYCFGLFIYVFQWYFGLFRGKPTMNTFEEIIPAKKKKLSAPKECIPTKMMKKKFPNREEFLASYFRQMFSLPDSMIYYITKNPKSSKCYQKMIQACKHFFIKNQILVFHCLQIDDDGWKVCSDDDDGTACHGLNEVTQTNITTEQLVGCKIWVQRRLSLSSTKSSNAASDLIPKVYQCDATNVIMDDQSLSMEQLLLYSKNVHICSLMNNHFDSETDSEVPIETIIASLPDVQIITYEFHPSSRNVSKDTVKKLLQIPHFKNIIIFYLYGISSDFDIDAFYNYYKKNKHMDCLIRYKDMPSPDYAAKLDEIIDEILDDKFPADKPPLIEYPGQDMEKKKALIELRKCTCGNCDN